jgi:hypothetical protein
MMTTNSTLAPKTDHRKTIWVLRITLTLAMIMDLELSLEIRLLKAIWSLLTLPKNRELFMKWNTSES